MFSYKEEQPGGSCAPAPLVPGLNFPFVAGGEKGVAGRGRGE